jgi:hypothetical protein
MDVLLNKRSNMIMNGCECICEGDPEQESTRGGRGKPVNRERVCGFYDDNASSGVSSRKDIGERGGYSPNSATASSCEKGGNVVGDDTRSPEGVSGGTLNMGFTDDGGLTPGLGG